jgi:dTDP-4-amino-4,6-dideoxygalactose transaminase
METNHIPILDLAPQIEELWSPINKAVQDVLKSGQFILGPQEKAFETEVAKYLGVKHAVGVNSGTDALVIGLRALGIGPGDEVITTSFTFFATAEAISMVGAQPVFVDIDPQTFNLDVALIESKINSKTKAIIPVHLYGQSVDMDALMTLAKKHGLKILEDVAQAMGCEYRGKKVGSLGDAGAFSFFPSKNLGAFGDGGLLTTNDDKVAETSRMLRAHGSKKKYFNETIGYNSRLDEMQAAILRVKLPYLDRWNDGRRAVARKYRELLAGNHAVETPIEAAFSKHVFHQYTIRIKGRKRDQVQKHLEGAGISTMIYYPVPIHKLPVYSGLSVNLPVTENACQEVISLPIWPEISDQSLDRIAKAIKAAIS